MRYPVVFKEEQALKLPAVLGVNPPNVLNVRWAVSAKPATVSVELLGKAEAFFSKMSLVLASFVISLTPSPSISTKMILPVAQALVPDAAQVGVASSAF